MTEPLLPPTPNDHSTGAADPGQGAPGDQSLVEGSEPASPHEIEEFSERMDAERDDAPLFRTPQPDDVARPDDAPSHD